ncbi:flavodoxin domain-containing protein [Besnoitia besnoiti]|uniref:NADPH--hemoprotein reductase n=1 Tax=Besnoitia besnoiti TaxID=94643 RepID=A0A2A9MI36_BESBE|nr:flavodoxin domain-containing protein [Besnoitia besnoiti]PFH37559.1 flavodoxin domain-containing protein [Besnoitia besnoiti]
MSSSFLGGSASRLLLISGVAVGTAALCYFLLRPSRPRRRGGKPGVAGHGTQRDAEEDVVFSDTLFVYFGSQSGTAEAFGEELASAVTEEVEGIKRVEVIDLEDFDPDAFLAQRYKVLVVATYGEGEPTDNARVFFDWLKAYSKSVRGSTAVPRMRGYCAVFGLGSTDYERFNRMGRRTFKMLEQIQSQQAQAAATSASASPAALASGSARFRLLCPLGLGDGAGDVGADFSRWLEELFFPALKTLVDEGGSLEDTQNPAEASGASAVLAEASLSPASPAALRSLSSVGVAAGETPVLRRRSFSLDFLQRSDEGEAQAEAGAEGDKAFLPSTPSASLSRAASAIGAAAVAGSLSEDAAIAKLQKRVEAWAKRHTDASFRLLAGPSAEALLAEQKRVEEEAAAKAGKAWLAPFAQVPHGTSAKFFFCMEEMPVKAVRQLRQRVTPCTSPPAAAETSPARGATRQAPGRKEAPVESTVEVNLDITDFPAVQYRAADTMYCLHRNAAEEIAWWHGFLGFKDQGVALSDYVHWLPSAAVLGASFATSSAASLTYAAPFPTPCTLEDALGFFCNLTGQLPKFSLATLSLWIEDPEERQQWLRLCCDDPHAQQVYEACVRSPLLTLRDLLPTLAPSFTRPFVDRLPAAGASRAAEASLQTRQLGLLLALLSAAHTPRAYTIASSPKALALEPGARSVSLCVGLVSERTDGLQFAAASLEEKGFKIFGSPSAVHEETRPARLQQEERLFLGACSSFITQQLRPGDVLKALIKPSTFRLPADVRTPVIMVAAGTGIAPFIAFLREFESLGGWQGPVVLFFGCQRADKDFLYRDELLRYAQADPGSLADSAEARTASDTPPSNEEERGVDSHKNKKILTHLLLAFSRQPGQPRKYVQDKIQEEKDLVWRLVHERRGIVYICGRSAMAAGVTEALVHAAAEKLGNDEARAKEFVHNLRTNKRIVEEVWA